MEQFKFKAGDKVVYREDGEQWFISDRYLAFDRQNAPIYYMRKFGTHEDHLMFACYVDDHCDLVQ